MRILHNKEEEEKEEENKVCWVYNYSRVDRAGRTIIITITGERERKCKFLKKK